MLEVEADDDDALQEETLSSDEEGGSGGNAKASAGASEAGGRSDKKPHSSTSSLPIDRGEAEFASASIDANDDSVPAKEDAPATDGDVEGGDVEGGRLSLTSPEAVNRGLRKRCYAIIALLLVVCGLIGVVVALVVNGKKDNDGGTKSEAIEGAQGSAQSTPIPTASPISSSPTDAPVTMTVTEAPISSPPTTENSFRLSQTLGYLVNFNVSDPFALKLQESPQYKAALWISQEDGHRLPVPSPGGNEEGLRWVFNQRYALAVLYFATGGPSWRYDMRWMREEHECEWWTSVMSMSGFDVYGVRCDGEPDLPDGVSDFMSRKRSVTGIEFEPQNNMVGTLPPEIRHLRYLKYLRIDENEGISGSLPEEFGELGHLRKLTLQKMSLSGKIPRSFANLKKLKYLELEYNMFSGNSENGDLDFLKEMTDLNLISFDYNDEITGTIPDISSVSKLGVLSFSNTGMYGTLPQSLSALTELRWLGLDDCAFRGSVDVLQSLGNLQHVFLEDNQFTGIINDTFFADSKNLVRLDVSNCSFSGNVPGHLFNFTQLEVLDMSRNNLGGELPAEAISSAQGSKLEFLSLHTNGISGPIPSSIKNLKKLTTLDLSTNEFSGDMPEEISELDNLNALFLGRNNFDAGPVPSWLRNMTRLSELSLKTSSLTGAIPNWLGEFSNLFFLDLGENGLTNTIPQSLENLSNLRVLILNSNRLRGQLGLSQAANLEVLLIDGNDITGNTTEMCAHELLHFVADCATGDGIVTARKRDDIEVDCPCCTLCCNDANTTCNDSDWLANHNGMWEIRYVRGRWEFEAGTVYPLFDYNSVQSQP